MEETEIWTEKYRPKKLEDMVGQAEIVARLKNFVKTKALPHTLFSGPPGTGKTTAALCLARELFGEEYWRQNLLELNASVAPETPILVRMHGRIRRTSFKELDRFFFRFPNQKYADARGLEILSLDENYRPCFRPVSLISRHWVDQIATIRYEGGKIRTSLDHSVMVISGEGRLVSKAVAEIGPGDCLITFRDEIPGRPVCVDFEAHKPTEFVHLRSGVVKNPKVKRILENRLLDEGLAWLFGMYLAEGCVSFPRANTSGVTIFTLGAHETEELGELQNIVSEELDLPYRLSLAPSGFDRDRFSAFHLKIFNTQLAKFLQQHFYDGTGERSAREKRIPGFMYEAPIGERLNFLKGYMGDAAGRWGVLVRYSSRSQEGLKDVAWLGRISGLDTSVYERETRVIWKLPSYSYVKTDLLPAEPFIRAFEKLNVPSFRYFMRHSLYYRKSKRISKEVLKNFFEEHGMNGGRRLQLLRKLLYSPLSSVLVRSVEISRYEGYVYDVSVPGTQVFWGGTTPVLLHNSDERGIDTIRERVKDYARTMPIGEVPYKIVLLDEADALTPEAQQALRRTMEMYSRNCRFILDCNYSSRIIEPIQSRCALFRFRRLTDEEVEGMLKKIAREEGLTLDPKAAEAIIRVSEGDLRRAINLLQAAAAVKKHVTEKAVYEVAAAAHPEEVREMVELALKGDFEGARKKLYELLIDRGLSGEDVLNQVHREILNLKIPERKKLELVERVGEFSFRITEGANERIQLEAMLAQFALVGS
ncbi:MAG: replication factor C small subunit [Candidatus Hadarchaeales archaeon]